MQACILAEKEARVDIAQTSQKSLFPSDIERSGVPNRIAGCVDTETSRPQVEKGVFEKEELSEEKLERDLTQPATLCPTQVGQWDEIATALRLGDDDRHSSIAQGRL